MATSHCSDGPTLSDGTRIADAIEESATPAEAAAISAAVRAHLRKRRAAAVAVAAAAADGEGDRWGGRQWDYASRREGVGHSGDRIPETLPTDAWTAAGRLD